MVRQDDVAEETLWGAAVGVVKVWMVDCIVGREEVVEVKTL